MKRALLIASLLLAGARSASAETKKLTLEEAVQLATTGNVQVEIGKEQILTAQAEVAKTKTYRLPMLGVKSSVFIWDSKIEFPGVGTVRDQVTGSAEVNIVQPITTAIILGKLIDLHEAGVDAERATLDQTKLDIANQVAQAYLLALQVRKAKEIADTSVKQLEANLDLVRKLRAADMLSDLDILRLEASRDAALQQALEAESNAETGERALVLLLGLPDGTDLELVDVDTTPPELGWTEDEAVQIAHRQRPEARIAAARSTQADIGIDVARAEYLPSVVAIANYTHTFNAGLIGSADSAFVGLSLEWNLWDWGQRKQDVAKARSASRMAAIAETAADDAVALDVRMKWLKASSLRKSVEVADKGLTASEEAYRLQNVRFAQGAVTATDVIDAEAEVARGRTQASLARYQYLIAWMALVGAVGEMPSLGAN